MLALKKIAYLVLLSLLWNGTPASAQSFRVTQIKVCNNYANRICAEIMPPLNNLDRRRFPRGRVYIAVTISCEDEALSFLNANDFLPVNAAIWKNGSRKDDIPIGITQEHWEVQGPALTVSAADQGSFPWRTNFNLQITDVRSIDIEISSAQGQVAFVGSSPARLNLTFAN